MSDLPDILKAYEAMNPWAQSLLLEIAQDYARQFPAPKKNPSLTLVKSSEIRILQPTSDLLDHNIDRSPAILARQPVNGK